MNKDKKVFNNKVRKTKKNNINKNENVNLTYTMGDELDKLFPQFKPSKKEENK